MGPIGCLETSVTNYHHSPRNDPEQRSSPFSLGITVLVFLEQLPEMA